MSREIDTPKSKIPHPAIDWYVTTLFAAEPRLSRFDVKVRCGGIIYVRDLVEIPSVELFKRFRTSKNNQERVHHLLQQVGLKLP